MELAYIICISHLQKQQCNSKATTQILQVLHKYFFAMEQLLEKIKDRVGEKTSPIRTVKSLAGAIGMSEAGFYTMLKRGTTKYGTLLAIADKLNVDVSYFSDDTSQHYNYKSLSQTKSESIDDSFDIQKEIRELKQVFEEQLRAKDRQIEKLLDLLGKPEGAICLPLSTGDFKFDLNMRDYYIASLTNMLGTSYAFVGQPIVK
ncbi:hypothetical protein [Spirosoma sordidisoli]|uniref:Uncharacterized protein n=1 Tax=Spirosoma sordidisoli TaxID=2502893 RepID=A0A4Q2UPX6_9BACT|nr:hypothetical protein [Spirosoma sordidisoli]RYC69841.1 hypothetical protein EQG79_14705 [Spirosoma sordidisoli]